MALKENDMQRERLLLSEMVSKAESERHELLDLRGQWASLKETNSSLHREIEALHDAISEQKVSLRRID